MNTSGTERRVTHRHAIAVWRGRRSYTAALATWCGRLLVVEQLVGRHAEGATHAFDRVGPDEAEPASTPCEAVDRVQTETGELGEPVGRQAPCLQQVPQPQPQQAPPTVAQVAQLRQEVESKDRLIFTGPADWTPEQAEQYIDWRIHLVDADVAKLRQQLDDLTAMRRRWLAVTGGRSKVLGNGNGNGSGNGHDPEGV